MIMAILAVRATLPVAGAFSEAPDLQRQVLAGTIPAVEQRLPIAPLVISPVEKLGEYGGTWRMVLVGYDSNSMLFRSLSYEHLVRWDPSWTRVVPNIASSWTVNADATVYRFQLRRGMRWSDGHPFTATDIVAWMDDVVRNTELTPVPSLWITQGGRLPECTAPDDYTVVFRFAAPNPLFLEQLAAGYSNDMTHYPAHYFRKMHPGHNPVGAAELMQQTNLPWADAFRSLSTPWRWAHIGIPTIDAWIVTNAYVPGVTTVNAVRNPYYWKVDTLGRQLPYLDQVKYTVVANYDIALQRALDGLVDYQRQDFASVNSAAGPAIAAAIKAGHLCSVRVIPSRSNSMALCLNLVHQDPGMRAMLSDKKVRIALSEGIDRVGLIQKLYGGEGKPWQLAPRPMSPFYNRRLGEQYTAYAPEHAKQLLDEAGLKTQGPDGLRYLPDGRPCKIEVMLSAPLGSPNWPAILELVAKDWRAIGVTMQTTILPKEDFDTYVNQNRHDAAVIKGIGGYAAIMESDFFVPTSFDYAQAVIYGIPWARWFVDPENPGAEKPPASVIKQMNVFRQVLSEPKREVRDALMAQVIAMAADEFYALGICLEPDRIAIRNPAFRNVPASHYDSWLYPDPGPFNPCQFFIEHAGSTKP